MADPFKDTRDPLVRSMERNAVLAIQAERDRYKEALEEIRLDYRSGKYAHKRAAQALYPGSEHDAFSEQGDKP